MRAARSASMPVCCCSHSISLASLSSLTSCQTISSCCASANVCHALPNKSGLLKMAVVALPLSSLRFSSSRLNCTAPSALSNFRIATKVIFDLLSSAATIWSRCANVKGACCNLLSSKRKLLTSCNMRKRCWLGSASGARGSSGSSVQRPGSTGRSLRWCSKVSRKSARAASVNRAGVSEACFAHNASNSSAIIWRSIYRS